MALLRGDGGGCSFCAATSCSRRFPSGATRRACRRCSPRSSARPRRTRRRRRTARRRRPSLRSARAASSARWRRWASSSSCSSGGPRRSAPRCHARRRAAAGGAVPLLAADATVLTATAHAAARELQSTRRPRGAAHRRPVSCVTTVWRRRSGMCAWRMAPPPDLAAGMCYVSSGDRVRRRRRQYRRFDSRACEEGRAQRRICATGRYAALRGAKAVCL